MKNNEPKFIIYIRGLFRENNSNYDVVSERLTEQNKKRLERYAHFYYWLCKSRQSGEREELIIVAITSLMEAMMSEVEFKDVFEYFNNEYRGKNSINDFEKFKNDYLQKYGAARKVKEYFNKYTTDEDISNLGIGIYKKDDLVSLDREKVAEFLYGMRSEFVHQARMRNFKPSDVEFMYTSMNGKGYKVKCDVKCFKLVFEKSFIRYWEEKLQT